MIVPDVTGTLALLKSAFELTTALAKGVKGKPEKELAEKDAGHSG